MPSLLILGGAACVFDDAEAALAIFEPDAVMACKDMIADWPHRLDYGVSLHPERNADYLRERARKGHPGTPQIWSHARNGAGGRAQVDREATDWRGASGLFGVRVGLHEGFDRIVLAGVPMTREAGHYKRGKPWPHAKDYLSAWRNRADEIRPYVRSMGGWTAELLGRPTKEWLAG